ncbi:MAG: hypothetical protein HY581_12190 [Nitrospirae bacterium]|nr:hypothetical protein [Nitrospirota bacterium]
MEARLTEQECCELFGRLFPNGLDDPDLVRELAPEGWERSPLAQVFHPTPEQIATETQRLRAAIQRWRGRAPQSEKDRLKEPEEVGSRPLSDGPVRSVEECAELIGLCLWDIFSNGHEVRTAEGTLVDLGSFRGAAGFIADFFRQSSRSVGLPLFVDYLNFYLGTIFVGSRADLTPVYELIFRRISLAGLDWRYVHPRLMLIDLGDLLEESDATVGANVSQYDPTTNYWRERERETQAAELYELEKSLDEAYVESVEEARKNLPPKTVEAYRGVYGRWPDGWPPEVEFKPSK